MKAHFAFLFAVCFACQAQQTKVGPVNTITGNLRGEDSSSIVGAKVQLSRKRGPLPFPAKYRPRWDTMSGPAGAFRFDGIPPGQYTLCVQAPSTLWLNPCEWGLAPPSVYIPQPQPSASFIMVLKRGARVPIRVNDAAQLLTTHEGKTAGAHLLLGVRSDALVFRTANIESRDSNGRNYYVLIPFNTNVKLVVASSFFQLSDGIGKSLTRTQPNILPVIVPSGQTPGTIQLQVTGGGK